MTDKPIALAGEPTMEFENWIDTLGYEGMVKYLREYWDSPGFHGAAPSPSASSVPEADAFEGWAKSEQYNMEQHPIHYLFLNPKTTAP